MNCSVADPDLNLVFLGHPDPDPQTDPRKSTFLDIHTHTILSKIHFRLNYFYIFIFEGHLLSAEIR